MRGGSASSSSTRDVGPGRTGDVPLRTFFLIRFFSGISYDFPFVGSRLLVTPLLSGEDTKQYRSLTVRAAYMAVDRACLGHCVRNLARRVQQP